MCGIAGIFDLEGGPVDSALVERMNEIQAHRGPDDHGIFAHGPVVLGHRRLSILDTSRAGHQPMEDAETRLVITYNGEIYNYVEIREQLAGRGHRFRSGSDTEVILAAYREWGEDCLHRFRGMFAFAIYDPRARTLFCVRDRLGVKPLVYARIGNLFAFASEEKALLALSESLRALDETSVFDFLASGYGYVDRDERTFFRDVKQLPAAATMRVRVGEVGPPHRYWRLEPDSTKTVADPVAFQAGIRRELEDAVRIRLRSDVPLSTALSGGIDSSAVTCLASRFLDGRLSTFSTVFPDSEINEERYVRAVLEATGAEGRIILEDEHDLASTLPRVVWHLDRPYAGPSVLATWAVFRAARAEGIPVMLNGQGGDELFAGYTKYVGPYLASLLQRGHLLRAMRETPLLTKTGVGGGAAWKLALRLLAGQWLERANGSRSRSVDAVVHPRLTSRSLPDHDPRPGFDLLNRSLEQGVRVSPLPSLLRNDDRMGMAHGVESRAPFLDVQLVEWAFRGPGSLKIRAGTLKSALREAVNDLLPPEVMERRDKLGFPVPSRRWLTGPLRALLMDELRSQRFRELELLRADVVERVLQSLVEGSYRGDANRIFSWLSLAVFCREFLTPNRERSTRTSASTTTSAGPDLHRLAVG